MQSGGIDVGRLDRGPGKPDTPEWGLRLMLKGARVRTWTSPVSQGGATYRGFSGESLPWAGVYSLAGGVLLLGKSQRCGRPVVQCVCGCLEKVSATGTWSRARNHVKD